MIVPFNPFFFGEESRNFKLVTNSWFVPLNVLKIRSMIEQANPFFYFLLYRAHIVERRKISNLITLVHEFSLMFLIENIMFGFLGISKKICLAHFLKFLKIFGSYIFLFKKVYKIPYKSTFTSFNMGIIS